MNANDFVTVDATYPAVEHASASPVASEPSVDRTTPSRRIEWVVRLTGSAMMLLFFVTWGSVWVAPSCGPRDEQEVVSVSGWDLTNGVDVPLPRHVRDPFSGVVRELPAVAEGEAQSISLSAQRALYIIPAVGGIVICLSIIARFDREERRIGWLMFYYLAAMSGSFFGLLVFMSATDDPAVSAGQSWLLRSPFPRDEPLAVEYSSGFGGMLMLLSIVVLGISGLVGMIQLWRVERRKWRAEEQSSQQTGAPPSQSLPLGAARR
jgi:hypothetical protein